MKCARYCDLVNYPFLFAVKPDKEEMQILERDTNAQDKAFDIKLCGKSPTVTTGKCDQYVLKPDI
jgi:hypothetical protein